VKKGEEVGYFHYGGSTYCLIFRPGAIARWVPDALPQTESPEPPLVFVGTKIATAN
jgi:phosphatidylserine decarboxylase